MGLIEDMQWDTSGVLKAYGLVEGTARSPKQKEHQACDAHALRIRPTKSATSGRSMLATVAP
jgi:hypothetical protein